jgi:hypothetical protein
MGAGLFALSVSEQAFGDTACPSHPPLKESFPVSLVSKPPKTPEFHTSDAVDGMLDLHPMSCNADRPHLSQIRASYNFEASRTIVVLPLISHMLEQGLNNPPSHEPPGQTSTLNEQLSSFPAPSAQIAINAPLTPSLSSSLRTRPLTTKLATQLPAVRALFNEASTTQHAPALPVQGPSDDLFHTRRPSTSTATEQRRLTSPDVPTSASHDGCNAQASCELEVTLSTVDWYKKLPRDLTEYVEKYQYNNKLSVGIDGLRIASSHYTCPFCDESKRKP